MDAFMGAIEASDEAEVSSHWADHQQLRKHVDTLGTMEYFSKVAGSTESVALFVPSDSFPPACRRSRPSSSRGTDTGAGRYRRQDRHPQDLVPPLPVRWSDVMAPDPDGVPLQVNPYGKLTRCKRIPCPAG
ncbi:hypothetical protein [Sphaerimonospora mesophila]|uniref:hypothetical protein n=1 Tax=Sphaerimonospora mesophila TaxID=37483 RepID=UPI0009F9FC02